MTDSEAPASSRPAPRPLIVGVVLVHLALLGALGWYLAQRPTGHWARVERGRRYLAQGRPDLAFREVQAVRDEAPGAAEAMTVAGQALLAQGQVVIARQSLQRALALNPNQADAAKMLAAIYLASGDGSRGIELLEKAAALDPRDFRPWYALGKVRHDLGEFDAAAEAYGKALHLGAPGAEAREARLGRLRALLDANRADEAAAELEDAHTRMPDEPRLAALDARAARAAGDLDRALKRAEDALRRDPDDFDALYVRAQVRQLRGDRDGALADLERAAGLNRNHLGALQLMLQLQTQLGQQSAAEETRARLERTRERLEAMNTLTKLIHQNPEDPLPRYQMGELAVEGGLDALAYRCFQAALDLDPKFQRAREALEKLPPEAATRSSAPGAGR